MTLRINNFIAKTSVTKETRPKGSQKPFGREPLVQKRRATSIAVLDAGGQYCHLIARRIRSFGVHAEILPYSASKQDLMIFSGIILSGGPSSVNEKNSPNLTWDIFELNKPILGICYGHQLIAQLAGGRVEKANRREYGRAKMVKKTNCALLKGVDVNSEVWMSHGDSVTVLPKRFQMLATTTDGEYAAIGNLKENIFGLQFHPEVAHTGFGNKILKNFVFEICKCEKDWAPENLLPEIRKRIIKTVGNKEVLFFVSGGVDSSVAVWLCNEALSQKQIRAVFLDTGFLRNGDQEAIEDLAKLLPNVKFNILDESNAFLSAVEEHCDPEQKRKAIGNTFHRVIARFIEKQGINDSAWILGQGTIYPDTIETAGTDDSALIKTHHNRSEAFQRLKKEGRLLEPLTEFYKDEVRAIAKKLGIPNKLSQRHPFPGPGLAIRCLCSVSEGPVSTDINLDKILSGSGLDGCITPIYSVGVKGDYRSYDRLVVLHGETFWSTLEDLSHVITNTIPLVNRVAWLLKSRIFADKSLCDLKLKPTRITRERLQLLRRADAIVTKFLKDGGIYNDLWQCPVVLVPLSFGLGETIAIRPVESTDGMTANFAQIEMPLLKEIANHVLKLDGVDAFLYDVTNKPPATIEWE